MFLIASGKYVEQELRNIFGLIPPTFLPLANKRLFQHQISLCKDKNNISISIPKNYIIDKKDTIILNSFDCEIIEVPLNVSLGQSIEFCLNTTKRSLNIPLTIIFGDSLFNSIPNKSDIALISNSKHNYDWSNVVNNRIQWRKEKKKQSNKIISGFFIFKNPKKLKEIIKICKYDFIKALDLYNKKQKLDFVQTKIWYDFGHLVSFFQSSSNFISLRFFNEINVSKDWIEKSSSNNLKINAEKNWYLKLPLILKNYTPHFLGNGDQKHKSSYKIERIYKAKLNELYVYSNLNNDVWKNIINHCLNFVNQCQNFEKIKDSDLQEKDIFLDKTFERLDVFCKEKKIFLNDVWLYNGINISIAEVLDFLKIWTPKKASKKTIIHGDLCFSNIFYDLTSDKITVIDPRGLNFDNNVTIYGDTNYDIAKLAHSILGNYDFILADYHNTIIDWDKKIINSIIFSEKKYSNVKVYFTSQIRKKFKLNNLNLLAMQINLFLSMLPLHKDDENRQNALFANAFRLYFHQKKD